jgi:nucleoside-diphosphate-sugar epimerase
MLPRNNPSHLHNSLKITLQFSKVNVQIFRYLIMTKIDKTKPIVLVLGSTGQVGKLIVEALSHAKEVQVRVTSRRSEQVEALRQKGQDAVYLDLDDPRTFAGALAGVDRLFLLTGYTVAMLVQSKTLIDAAKKAGVQHIVHLGIFGEWDCTDPHFAWHQMIERYIEASGMAWTHLHPNYIHGKSVGDCALKRRYVFDVLWRLPFGHGGSQGCGGGGGNDIARRFHQICG